MFTPYHRSWERASRREPLSRPRSLPGLPAGVQDRPDSGADGARSQPAARDPPAGGERAGRARLDSFLADGVDRYHEQRDALADAGTSALSPYLHFGCLSPREVEHRLPDSPGAAELRRQLCWRDFYAQVTALLAPQRPFRASTTYRGMRWSRARRNFDAWRDGRTGYPVVDAAMRQLRREGWIHNRGRLIVGSFLTKDLGSTGAGASAGSWSCWSTATRPATTGTGSGSRRSASTLPAAGAQDYNPSRQQERFDPDGIYVRRYVPELERVPRRVPHRAVDDARRGPGGLRVHHRQ